MLTPSEVYSRFRRDAQAIHVSAPGSFVDEMMAANRNMDQEAAVQFYA